MLRITIEQADQDVRDFVHAAGPLEFGRGAGETQALRCQIQDRYVSKDHLRVLETGDRRVRLENLSRTNPVQMGGEPDLAVGATRDLALPVKVVLGETTIHLAWEGAVEAGDPEVDSFHGGLLRTIKRTLSFRDGVSSDAFLALRSTLTPERLLTWFETVVAVQRAAAGSPQFYSETARALVDLVGLDRGVVLLRRGEEWEVAAEHGRESSGSGHLSRSLLRSVLLKKRTSYRTLDTESLTGSHHWVDEIVCSPILNAKDEVVGALYGSRDVTATAVGVGLGALEAQVVQLLAAVVATGLARLEQEAEAARSRVQLEQVFTPELASLLERDPHLLDPQEREVTVLFADMRGSSSLAEGADPRQIYGVMGELMDRITGCVREQQGVVVDYAGDGLLAVWNAPTDQPDHAQRACRAGLRMATELVEVNRKWHPKLSRQIGMGIGIHTGRALVGNTGTRYKLKYGPRGHTVNLGSRVEGATKHLGIGVLITRATREALPDGFATRRLCRARLFGLTDPVDLYELSGEERDEEWQRRCGAYQKALELFESGNFSDSCHTLYPLLSDAAMQNDVPCLTLLTRAVECLKTPPKVFDPIFVFDTK